MAGRQPKTDEGLIRVSSYITEEIKEVLQELAHKNRRSISAELAIILETWLKEKGYLKDELDE